MAKAIVGTTSSYTDMHEVNALTPYSYFSIGNAVSYHYNNNNIVT